MGLFKYGYHNQMFIFRMQLNGFKRCPKLIALVPFFPHLNGLSNLSKINSSICIQFNGFKCFKHNSFNCIQLYGFKQCNLIVIIQFDINHLLTRILMFSCVGNN